MQENGQTNRLKSEVTRWLIFFGVAISLTIMLWLGWSLTNRRNPITSFGTLISNSTVAIGVRSDAPESLDIRTVEGHTIEQALLSNVYETLVSRNENNEVQAGIAKSWQVSEDGLTYTFTLNDDVTFSNGHQLESSDVVWSLQSIVSNSYVGADQLSSLQEITNPDEKTVVITLSQPNPRLLRALSGRAGIVYDKDAANTDYAKTAVGSGPFTVSNASKSQIILQRNDSYWGTKAASSQITVYYYSSEDSMVSAMKAGKISMALPLSASASADMNSTHGFSSDSGIGFDKVMLAFNNSAESLFSDEQIRKMMRYGIDANAIAGSADDSYGALGGPISPLEDGYEDLSGLYPYNLEQAQQLRSFFDSTYISDINLLVPREYEQLGNTIKSQIEQIGNIGVNLEVLNSAGEVRERMNNGTYSAALVTMSDENDASVFTDGQSIFHYENGEAQQSYNDALAASNDNNYQERMRNYARIVSEDAASEWLYTRKNFIAVADKLQGYPKNMTDRLLPLSKLALH